jgi:phosphoribosylaminoimidazolecarboxamide formyltransferase/IMP cyclohydrolase
VEAFRKTSHYDGMIAQYFSRRFELEPPAFPQHLAIAFDHTYTLRYGENPHQKAGYYQDDLTSDIRGIEQLHGIALSYNNIVDVDAAVGLISEFTEKPTVAIIKHTNPCGVGTGSTLLEAYERANATDPVSSFGSIICVNRKLDMPIAEKLRHHFVEVLLAPDFDVDALALLKEKKKLRILRFNPKLVEENALKLRSALGGLLVQESDRLDLEETRLRVATKRTPTESEWQALRFAWKVVKHVKSNAIVFANAEMTLGIGAGQMSRVDSAELAIKKAQNAGLGLKGSVVASEAFFPFRDGLDVAAKAGATAVIQPGGSIRDEEVIQAADEQNVAMVLTGIRHFRH